MENKEMNLSIVCEFRKKLPGIEIRNPKWAECGIIAEEFRRMDVGDIVLFPVSSYKPTTVRSTPSATMLKEVLEEGRQWSTMLDKENKSVAVLRIA